MDNNLIYFFERGLLYHGDLAGTLQAFYLARDEMKSDDRDGYIGIPRTLEEKVGRCKKVLDL